MKNRKEDERLEILTREIRTLSERVAGLQGKKDFLEQAGDLADEIVRLKETVQDLKIQKSRVKEEQDKREREILHKVGLEQKRQEFEAEQKLSEISAAEREAVLKVREENLQTEKDAFQKEMQFVTKRFEQENTYVREILESILSRLPDVSVALGGNTDKED